MKGSPSEIENKKLLLDMYHKQSTIRQKTFVYNIKRYACEGSIDNKDLLDDPWDNIQCKVAFIAQYQAHITVNIDRDFESLQIISKEPRLFNVLLYGYVIIALGFTRGCFYFFYIYIYIYISLIPIR